MEEEVIQLANHPRRRDQVPQPEVSEKSEKENPLHLLPFAGPREGEETVGVVGEGKVKVGVEEVVKAAVVEAVKFVVVEVPEVPETDRADKHHDLRLLLLMMKKSYQMKSME